MANNQSNKAKNMVLKSIFLIDFELICVPIQKRAPIRSALLTSFKNKEVMSERFSWLPINIAKININININKGNEFLVFFSSL